MRVPLIIVPPRGLSGFRRGVVLGPDDAIVEALDIMPTLIDALGLGSFVPPGQMQGRSLLPLLRTGAVADNTTAAFSQIVRSAPDCTPPSATLHAADPQDSDPPALLPLNASAPPCPMGVTMRVHGWRYTAWVGYRYEGKDVGPVWADLRGEELYDHAVDDAQNGADTSFDADELVNLADNPAFATVKATLVARMRNEWASHGGG